MAIDPSVWMAVIFVVFFAMGYESEKRSGGFFLLLSGFAMIGLGVLLHDSLILINTMTTPMGIFILLLGGRKAFFGPESTEKELNEDVTSPYGTRRRRRRR